MLIGAHRRTVITAAALVSVVLAAAAATAGRSAFPSVGDRAARHRQTTGVIEAGSVLHGVADALTASPSDATTGPYEYIEIRTWFHTTSGPDGTIAEQVVHHHHWTGVPGTGRHVTFTETDGCHLDGDESWTGSQPEPFAGPLSSDPGALRRQILHNPPALDDPPHLIGQITELASYRYLPLRVRVGILRVLARQPGVTVRRPAIDRLGRAGIDVVMQVDDPEDNQILNVLTISPSTGELLASRSTLLDPAGAPDPRRSTEAAARARAVMNESSILYLTSTRTANTATPAVSCPPASDGRKP